MSSKMTTRYTSRIEWLPVSVLEVAPEAQRPFEAKAARAIAADFDPDRIGYPLVVGITKHGKEHYYILDGQHRVAAVRLALGDDQLIQCEVKRGLTIQEAAKLFLGRNAARAPRATAKFLVAVTAGYKAETDVHQIIQEAGQTVTHGGSGITAVTSLMALYRIDQGQTLRRTLAVLTRAWGNKRPEVFNGDVMRGTGEFLRHFGEDVEDPYLVRRLAALPSGPDGLLGRGRGYKATLGGTTWRGIANSLVGIYNVHRKKKLPPFGQDVKKDTAA